ncbi:MAG: hypothetical protein J1G38_02070 [Clostridiales bacterium]|nr:hypothetical protein [Clostridiales bacterium]
MKIEILEQAFASYLKNYEGCQITTTNWTVSKVMLDSLDAAQLKTLKDIIADIDSVITPSIGKCVFKGSKPLQFIKQCEIDVVGMKFGADGNDIYLYDSAFHENGLNYRDNVANVLKKLIRAFIIGELYFKGLGFTVHVGFITPVCKPKVQDGIDKEIPALKGVLETYDSGVQLDLFLDSNCTEIINELVGLVDDINDDNDLFIRAIKLLNTTLPKAKPTHKNKDVVMDVVDELIKGGLFTAKLVDNLCDAAYSNKTFGLKTFPFMKEFTAISANEQIRYYATLKSINGKQYKICNMWYESDIKKLKEWFDTKQYLV